VSRLELAFQWVLQSSWQAAVLIVFILALQRIFRRQLGARWRAGLWLLVMIRLLFPFGPTTSWSLFHYLQPDTAAAWATHVISPSGLAEPRDAGTPADAATVPAEARPSKSWAAAVPAGSSRDGLRWALGLWLLVTFALAARSGWQNGWLVWRLRKCRPVTDAELLALLADCRQRAGVRTALHLVETDLVRSPALYGFGRWWLLWPTQVMAKLGREQRRYVLLHELAHLRRWDPWINWLINGVPVGAGATPIATNSVVAWSATIHKGGGNITLGDGSVQPGTSARLQEQVRLSSLATNRLLSP